VEAVRRLREDWFSDEYVDDWIGRQEDRNSERQHQFAMIRSIIPRRADEPFRYLNIGAGDGRLDECLLAHFPRAEATLLDGSTRMLEHARERLRAFNGRVTFAEGDLRADWSASVTGPVDVAVSTIAIHNLREGSLIRKVYTDAFALLADGGFLVNLDYLRASSPRLTPLSALALASRDAWPMGRPRSGSGSSGTIEEQLIWLRDAGFAPVDCFWKEFQVAMFGGFKNRVQIPE
jgi:SAM-dependent methyltransferase